MGKGLAIINISVQLVAFLSLTLQAFKKLKWACIPYKKFSLVVQFNFGTLRNHGKNSQKFGKNDENSCP